MRERSEGAREGEFSCDIVGLIGKMEAILFSKKEVKWMKVYFHSQGFPFELTIRVFLTEESTCQQGLEVCILPCIITIESSLQ